MFFLIATAIWGIIRDANVKFFKVKRGIFSDWDQQQHFSDCTVTALGLGGYLFSEPNNHYPKIFQVIIM